MVLVVPVIWIGYLLFVPPAGPLPQLPEPVSKPLPPQENAWVAYPINRYESYQAFSTQSLESVEKSSAIVTTAEKPISRFYNAIPANDYDIVINPEVLEPCVQFSYNLVVRFTLPAPKPVVKTEIKKEFIMVTPGGEVKTLKIE